MDCSLCWLFMALGKRWTLTQQRPVVFWPSKHFSALLSNGKVTFSEAHTWDDAKDLLIWYSSQRETLSTVFNRTKTFVNEAYWVFYFYGRDRKQGEICSFLLFREWQHGTPGWPIWMTKVVKLFMVIAVDETGTVLLPFPHILVNTEQIPTSYKVLVLSLLSVKILYFVEAIPNNIPAS